MNTEEFIIKSKLIHVEKFDYSLFEYKIDDYKNVHSKINITCRKGHIFYQKVYNHLQGKGCNVCRESLGERNISIFLENNKIKYTRQKKFKGCKYISLLTFDFYIDHQRKHRSL